MFFTLYAAICAIWICYLVLNVVKVRTSKQVAYGDGGEESLIIARTAHGNAVETIPVALLLLLGLELNQGSIWLLHFFGITLLVGRGLHGIGVLSKTFKARVLGMQITVFTLVGLSIANLLYLPIIRHTLGF
ncbi:hypothetical protein CBF23_006350 [Marinomonas agarivorans]|nr:hypothetical protein CBF23_006350 [Marinomonas agarivorans]